MALEAVNQKSKVIVHNSTTDLTDKTPLEGYQGAAIEDVAGFEKFSYQTAPDETTTTAKTGESVIVITGGGVPTRYICLGGYGSTLRKNQDLAASVSPQPTAAVDTAGTTVTLSGGSGEGAKADYVVTGGSGTLDSLKLKKTATGYKAGDVLTFNVVIDDGAGGTTNQSVEIVLTQTLLNQAEWAKTANLTLVNALS